MLQAACDATGSNEATQVLELVAHIEGSCGEVLAWHLMWHLGGWADLGPLCPIHSIHRLLGRRVGGISPDFVQDQRKFSRKVTKFYHHFFQLLDLPRVPSDIYARLQVCTDAFHQPCIAPKSRLQGLPFHLPWWSSELPSLQQSQASADVLGINLQGDYKNQGYLMICCYPVLPLSGGKKRKLLDKGRFFFPKHQWRCAACHWLRVFKLKQTDLCIPKEAVRE